MKKVLRGDLVLPGLSYEIIGACFETYNEIGPGKPEKIYQRALAQIFQRQGIEFLEQVRFPIMIDGVIVGEHRFDFLVNQSVIVELKVANAFRQNDYDQIRRYLFRSGSVLGLLIRFGSSGVTSHRILPPNQGNSWHS